MTPENARLGQSLEGHPSTVMLPPAFIEPKLIPTMALDLAMT